MPESYGRGQLGREAGGLVQRFSALNGYRTLFSRGRRVMLRRYTGLICRAGRDILKVKINPLKEDHNDHLYQK